MDDTTGTTGPAGTAVPPPPPPGTAGRRPPLRRSRGDRKLFGVAGGLGAYLGVDPLLVRIAFVVLALSGVGAGVVLYLACAVLVPEEPAAPGAEGSSGSHDPAAARPAFVDRHGKLLAVIAGVIAVSALLGGAGPFGWGDHGNGIWGVLWIALVVTVVVLVVKEVQSRRDAPAPLPAYQVAAQQAAAQQATPSQGAQPYGGAYATGRPAHATAPLPPPGTPGARSYSPGPPAVPPVAPAPPEPDPASGVGVLTLGAVLVSVGVLVGLDRADVVDVSAVMLLATALVNVGVGLVVAAFVGRARWLIAVGVVLALLTSVAALDPPGNGSVGDVDWHPTSAAELQSEYRWGVGETTLDLTDVRSTEPLRTSVEQGVGSLSVLLPADATVHVSARVGAGSISGVGDQHDGIRQAVEKTLLPTRPAGAAGDEPAGTTIELDLHVGLGEVKVTRVD